MICKVAATRESVKRFSTASPSKPTQRSEVVVLDNAHFHKAKNLRAKEARWQAKGLYLRYLPPYSPQLNPIEALWRVLKGFLLPRRLYASLKNLEDAVFSVLSTLGAISS